MARSEPEDDADEAYMTMDADQWNEDDNTYATADELDLDLTQTENSKQDGTNSDSSKQKKSNMRPDVAAVNRRRTLNPNPHPAQVPIPHRLDRYITIKPPLKGQNGGPAMTQLPHSNLSRCIVIFLLVLCSVLITVICALSVNYGILSKDRKDLVEKQQDLTQQIENLKFLSLSNYYIFTEIPSNSTLDSKKQLFILNYEVLQEIEGQHFDLGNSTDRRKYLWICYARSQRK